MQGRYLFPKNEVKCYDLILLTMPQYSLINKYSEYGLREWIKSVNRVVLTYVQSLDLRREEILLQAESQILFGSYSNQE